MSYETWWCRVSSMQLGAGLRKMRRVSEERQPGSFGANYPGCSWKLIERHVPTSKISSTIIATSCLFVFFITNLLLPRDFLHIFGRWLSSGSYWCNTALSSVVSCHDNSISNFQQPIQGGKPKSQLLRFLSGLYTLKSQPNQGGTCTVSIWFGDLVFWPVFLLLVPHSFHGLTKQTCGQLPSLSLTPGGGQWFWIHNTDQKSCEGTI